MYLKRQGKKYDETFHWPFIKRIEKKENLQIVAAMGNILTMGTKVWYWEKTL